MDGARVGGGLTRTEEIMAAILLPVSQFEDRGRQFTVLGRFNERRNGLNERLRRVRGPRDRPCTTEEFLACWGQEIKHRRNTPFPSFSWTLCVVD